MKYHISPKTGNPNQCRAQKDNCPFGGEQDHYASKEEARSAYEQKQKSPFTRPARTPIILPPPAVAMPYTWDFNFYNVEEFTDAEAIDYYTNDYSEPTFFDAPQIIAKSLKLKQQDWPADLTALVAENAEEWSKPEKWYFEMGYYEEGPSVTAPEAMEEKLQQWYYNQPNAVDHNGVLTHVREKGYTTAGLPPVEALKKMLREENDKILAKVERATFVGKRKYNFDAFTFSEAHHRRITAEEPTPANPEAPKILGVIFDNGRRGRPSHLLDGHHRLKWSQENGETSGEFLYLG